MHYRRDIDGLRAVAVASVIASHAGAPLPGGFLGVDIFFVISGFLITRILLREMEEGRFSLARFYERRARRILPAMIVVVLVCLPPAWMLLPPAQMTAFGQSLVALSFFSTNVLFWQQAGYFAPAAEEIPLIHTWSLGVEEQFYLLFPLLCLALWRSGRLMGVMVVLALLSLGAAEVAARILPDAAFYLLPFRAWELLAGALAAGLANSGVRPQGWLALFGLGLIGGSLTLFHHWLPIPGVWLVAPVGGTALVLLFTGPDTLAGRLLSWRPAVWLGLISYSAYLWHQPLFAFARISRLDPPPGWAMAVLTILTVGVAWVSWRYVERPCRHMDGPEFRRLAGGMAVAMVLIAGFGGAAHLTGGLGGARFTAELHSVFASAEASPRRSVCHDTAAAAAPPDEACVYPAGSAPSWAVFGDSHAVEVAHALGEGLRPRGESLVHLSASGCPPALTFDPGLPGCADWVARNAAWLEAKPEIRTIVLVWRHSAYLFGRNEATYPDLPDLPYRIENPGTPAEKRERYWRSVEDLVERLARDGRRVVLVAPVPEIVRPVWKHAVHRAGSGGRVAGIPVSYYHARNSFVLTRIDQIGAEILHPAEHLCDRTTCYSAIDGEAMYFDDNHLSLAGARRIIWPLLTGELPSDFSRLSQINAD